QVDHRLRRVRLDGRLLPELLDDAGLRPDHPRRRLHPGLSATPRAGARRPDDAAGQDPEGSGPRPGARAAGARGVAALEEEAEGRAMSAEALSRAKTILGDLVTASHSYRGDDTLVVNPVSIVDVMRQLKEDPELQMNFLVDLTAVDYLGRDPRFE